MGILNESGEGDEEREYAYTGGKEGTVIDYVIVGEDVRKRLNRLEVGKQIDSDHQAVTVHVQIKSSRSYKKGNGEDLGLIREGKKKFKEETEELELEKERMEETVEAQRFYPSRERIENIREKVNNGEKEKGEWWDEECRVKKRKVKKAM